MNVVEFLNDLAARGIAVWLASEDVNQLRYRAPKDAMTPTLIDELKRNKSEVTAWLRESNAVAKGVQLSYPLSNCQLGLWLEWRLDPASARFNLSTLDRLPPDVCPDTLRQAAQALVDCHPVLRTIYPVRDGDSPMQVVQPQQTVDFTVIDSINWTTDQLSAWIEVADGEPFDLSTGPIMRMVVLRRLDENGQDSDLLHWTIHHIATDYSGQAILHQELTRHYQELRDGRNPALRNSDIERALTYHDYVRWERDVVDEQAGHLTNFWQSHLAEAAPLLDLSLRRSRAENTARLARLCRRAFFGINPELAVGLRELAKAHQVTAYSVLLAAYQVLLYRYTGQENFLVVSPSSTRVLPGWSKTVGYFVNPLPLRADLADNPTFAELLGRVNENRTLALQHQMYPYREMLRQLQRQAANFSSEDMPGFVFVSRRSPAVESSLLESVSSSQRGMPQALTLTIYESAGELTGSIAYDRSMFDEAAVERMVGHFQTLLAAIVENPARLIDKLPLLTQAERQQRLAEWNANNEVPHEDKCIHELFEQQAERIPDNSAVVCDGRSWTYLELNTRANQIAHHLRNRGVGRETLVLICVERSLEMIAGILGILKAGGAYLPLDPSHPTPRLAFMIEDSGAALVLTQQHLKAKLPMVSAPVVCLDEDWQTIASQPHFNPLIASQEADLAYVLYTSGSSGQPKGVMIEHRNVLALLRGFECVAPSGERLIGTAVCPYGFDVSVWEILSQLCFGGTLHLLTSETTSDADRFVSYLVENKVTSAYIPPAMLGAVMDKYERDGRRWTLDRLLVGVEPIKQSLLQRFLSAALELRIMNGYGPTECTVCSTFYPFTNAAEPERPTPIGKAVAGYQTYILDRNQEPSPDGMAGELCIGGAGVGRGYLNRPELTAERFLELEVEGRRTRVYKSGDMVRRLPDDNIEFIGRADRQIKLRGLRIELGEIESALGQLSSIKEAVVEVASSGNGENHLVAYIVTDPGSGLDTRDLRPYLQARLPEYMTPTAFVLLDQLPLTSRGKVDRKALALLDPGAKPMDEPFSPPRTPIESALAAIWSEVLGTSQIGIHNNFFALGGHSLLAAQVVSRIRQTLKVDLSMRVLFEASTIEMLAAQVAKTCATGESKSIPKVDRSNPLPLSFNQEQLWFLDRAEAQRNVYNIPTVLRLTGKVDVDALEASLQEIVRRHESLRTIFPVANGQPVQLIQPESFTLDRVDLTTLNEKEREFEINYLVKAEVNHEFDLTKGALFRATLACLQATEYLLLLNLHHIVADGWSMQVLTRELGALYAAFVEGKASPLLPSPLQYAEFALWQRTTWTKTAAAGQLAYWKQQLNGVPPLLMLPTDCPRPAVQTHCGSHYYFDLPQTLNRRIQSLSAEENASVFMTLLAAFMVLLMRYSGQTDIVVGSPVANRNHLDLEPLIGFFVNNIVLRGDLSSGISFHELLEQIRAMSLEAYCHQDTPFAKIVEHLHPERNLSHSPLFNVVFDLVTSKLVDITLPGMTVENVENIEVPVAKFDLTLSILEGRGGRIEYNTDLFDRKTIERMAASYKILLEAIVEQPEQFIDKIPLLNRVETHQILFGWNNTAPQDSRVPNGPRCFHHLFEEQAERTPDNLAVVFDSKELGSTVTLTYRELNHRANQLAHHLRSLGVGASPSAETLVGLCAERSPEMIVALMAILKAGGAYVPLDPAYPADRLAFMLHDTQAPFVITRQQVLHNLPDCKAVIVYLDLLALEDQPTTNLNVPVTPDQLAYIIYTSGSTGKPKGVLIEHRGLCNTSDAQVEAFGLKSNDRHLLFFSLSFDGCTADIILALRVGATLVFAPQREVLPGEPLRRFLRKHAISTLILTPSALAPVPAVDLPDLRLVIVAGETCSAELVARWAHGRRFLNLYGATEASIFSTVAVCRNDGRPPAVGRPVVNNKIYILDKHLLPVPVGVPGEIYIGGAGVARGYHNRPELNQTRFISNPFESGRLYKTGDLGRYRLQSGIDSPEIEFLGRIDNQVKLRGFRIELDEIEVVLSQHPVVRESVVTVHMEEDGRQRLVAHVVENQGSASSLDPQDLRSYIQTKLPEYMVPAVFVLMDQLPLTANGKVDRKALPAPAVQTQYVSPQSGLERSLAAIWQSLLKIDNVGVHDNFFELGGHSLLIIQLQSKVEELLESPVPVTELFQFPTIASFAGRIARPSGLPPADRPASSGPRRVDQSELRKRRQGGRASALHQL